MGSNDEFWVDTLAVLRPVQARIPHTEEIHVSLCYSLQQMGLEKLLDIPWNVELDNYLQDFVKDSAIPLRFVDHYYIFSCLPCCLKAPFTLSM